MTATVLGVDIGTSAVKAMLLDAAGVVRGMGRQTYPTRHDAPGLSEQSPRDWLKAATDAIRQAVAAHAPTVAAISLGGHMSAPVLIGAAGEPLAACHIITDSRAETDLPPDCHAGIEARTGNKCAAYFSLPKLLWWRRHDPDVLERARHVLAPKDFVALWLTGVAASDPSDSGNMLLLDPVSRRWMPDLARAAGLDPTLLPPLAEPGALLGHLRPEVADALGLPSGVPVAMGASDMAAALLGAGIAGDEIAVTIGTSATVIAGADGIDARLTGRLTFHPGAAPGALFVLGSHFNGGACLDWLSGILGGPERLRAAARAAETPQAADPPLFIPYLLGAGSPDFDPAARGAFLGLAASHGPADLLRAVVQGITADLCLSLDLIDPDGRRPIVLAGGGANLRIWPQIMADLAARPVTLATTADASTKGAALLAGVSLGWFGGTVAEAARRARDPGASFTPGGPSDLRRRFNAARR
jgi:xylulokinase